MSNFSILSIKTGEDTSLALSHIVSYKVLLIDVDGEGAGTTEDGTTVRDIRRRNKAKITVRLDGMTLEEFTAVMSAINSDSFECTYFHGEFSTIIAHAGDRNIELIKAANDKDSRWRLDLSIIEY
ncbi:MAG: hypothetical protein IJZ95_07255 [Oscillospiraceae bacterium]|nr:hypothetical protein [Oscillospiraceae bacterium]